MAHFLGLDSSTQSLTALIIDTDSGQVVADHSVNFGERLPQYKLAERVPGAIRIPR